MQCVRVKSIKLTCHLFTLLHNLPGPAGRQMMYHVLGTEIGALQTLAPLIPQLSEVLSMITIFKAEETEPWKG